MMRMQFSRAGAGLVRALLSRAGAPFESVRLVSYQATEWRSMTFDGERHEIQLRIAGEACAAALGRLLDGLGEHEFDLGEDLVAEIGGVGVADGPDGAIDVRIEALTVSA